MKLVVIGLGQCGGRIADEFSKLDSNARRRRGMNIVADTFAINADTSDLSGLTSIKSDYQHRILIGNRRTGGHGVGKINELGAQLAMDDGEKVISTLRASKPTYEADAFLLIASAAGGTGSGSLPIITEMVKERFKRKPIYALVVLPFEHEEKMQARTRFNTATCLKSIFSVADAVFLVDNQVFIEKDSSLRNNMVAINHLIADPFYDLLCAGEVRKSKNVGAKLLDAGDIISSLGGWTTLGYGVSNLPVIRLPFERLRDFRKKTVETSKGIQAMDQALSNLSINCNPKDSASALFLVSAPATDMNMDMVNELLQYLNQVAPDAAIRYGDYPRSESTIKVTVILSQLGSVDMVKKFFTATPGEVKRTENVQRKNAAKVSELMDSASAVPSLFRRNGNGNGGNRNSSIFSETDKIVDDT